MDSFNISILNNVFRIMRTLCALDKIIFFFNKNIRKSVKVAVYGDSGTGKTQFLMTITGNNNYTAERTRSLKSFILILKNGRKIEFIDTPGHQSAKTIRDTLKRKFIKNKIEKFDFHTFSPFRSFQPPPRHLPGHDKTGPEVFLSPFQHIILDFSVLSARSRDRRQRKRTHALRQASFYTAADCTHFCD